MTTDLYPDRLGFCYVLTNPHMPGICKIGATRKHPLSRVKELSSPTGVPGDYELAYYHAFSDSFAAESLTHAHFAAFRINESREFFEVTEAVAIAFIETLSGSEAYRERVGAEWNDGVEDDPLKGGTYQRAPKTIATPFADLFASFEDRGDGVLNAAEQAQCRALERRTL